jgi:hypothetical protein
MQNRGSQTQHLDLPSPGECEDEQFTALLQGK